MRMNHLKNRVTLKITDSGRCIGCGMCVEVCPHDVFEVIDRKAVIIDKNRCMECGACQKNCPVGIIQVDAGVGCAAAMIAGLINNTAPQCGCSTNGKKSGCC